jgi:hypothetical protein
MIVQNSIDVQKLNFVKERIKERPLNAAFTQPLPRRTRQTLSPSHTIDSPSADTNPLTNQIKSRQDNLSVSHNVEISKTNQTEINRSELNDDDVSDKKLQKNKLKVKQHSQSSTRKF